MSAGYAMGFGTPNLSNDLEKDLGLRIDPTKPSYTLDYGQSNEDRANQMLLLQQLQQMAAGNGPSLAQGQLQQATDSNIRQAMALGAAQQGQGLGYASALRNIADQSAAARQQAAAQSAMIRNAEQMQAMQGQASLLGGMRGQDLGQQQLGAANAFGYDQMAQQAAMASAQNRSNLFGNIINAGGGLLGKFLSPTGQGQQQSGGGGQALQGNYWDMPTPYSSQPVMSDGSGFRGSAVQPGDWTTGNVAHASSGGQVPGYAQGGAMDSRRNDTVPAMLSPGEIVIPRSITMAPDAAERAKLFVQEVQRRRASPPSSDEHPVVRDAMRKRKAA